MRIPCRKNLHQSQISQTSEPRKLGKDLTKSAGQRPNAGDCKDQSIKQTITGCKDQSIKQTATRTYLVRKCNKNRKHTLWKKDYPIRCVCMLYNSPARPKCGHMAAVLKTACRSICRASIYTGRRWPFLLWYCTTLYMSLSQLRLLVSVLSTVQNKYKKNRQSPPIPRIKEKEKSKKKRSRFPNG